MSPQGQAHRHQAHPRSCIRTMLTVGLTYTSWTAPSSTGCVSRGAAGSEDRHLVFLSPTYSLHIICASRSVCCGIMFPVTQSTIFQLGTSRSPKSIGWVMFTSEMRCIRDTHRGWEEVNKAEPVRKVSTVLHTTQSRKWVSSKIPRSLPAPWLRSPGTREDMYEARESSVFSPMKCFQKHKKLCNFDDIQFFFFCCSYFWCPV